MSDKTNDFLFMNKWTKNKKYFLMINTRRKMKYHGQIFMIYKVNINVEHNLLFKVN